MVRLLTTLRRGFKERIGWKRVGVAASLVIIAFAITTLVRTLKNFDTGAMLVALTNISIHQIALAALCVVGAFCTLTFYDFFALRTLGKKHVPYRIAALSSFTSYSIGHNIGATVFTGGAIRFRIYSDHGLSAIDVAKICFLSGLTFWLGNTFVLGIGMAWHPSAASAMDQLPAAINRLIAFGVIGAIISYLVWLILGHERRELGQNGWMVRLPSAPLTLVQILIGVVDLGFCAMAMYLLMPAQPHIDFMSLAVVFILATLLGFASHAPGSLGVFDAAMLVALPQFGKEQLAATIVVFRILYFMIPFGIAISIMGTRELWLNVVLPWQLRRRQAEACAEINSETAEAVEVGARTVPFRQRSRAGSRR
ncbi:YbhN family protein [Bradyrhizobium sp.]|uniref:lysylphosphatidylglycerol synthase transmembrane domain-containing protein n=1 Tax=Bradyrhizobium sp. TaxID=376 RepID=UPI00260E229F|nr:YbhN family protein [Bradyrhizobium sp.]